MSLQLHLQLRHAIPPCPNPRDHHRPSDHRPQIPRWSLRPNEHRGHYPNHGDHRRPTRRPHNPRGHLFKFNNNFNSIKYNKTYHNPNSQARDNILHRRHSIHSRPSRDHLYTQHTPHTGHNPHNTNTRPWHRRCNPDMHMGLYKRSTNPGSPTRMDRPCSDHSYCTGDITSN